MNLQEAYNLLENKCATVGCWHYTGGTYNLCKHCLHGSCSTIQKDERDEYRKAMRIVKKEAPNAR